MKMSELCGVKICEGLSRDLLCLKPKGHVEEEHGAVEPLLARIKELEDTILLRKAEDAVYSSSGRNDYAAGIVREIASRRGEDWNGAEIEGLNRI
jgi:hypothetical protein